MNIVMAGDNYGSGCEFSECGRERRDGAARGGTAPLSVLADGKTTTSSIAREKERKRVGQGSRGEWDRAASSDGGSLKSKIEQRLLATLAELWARAASCDGGGAIPCKKSGIFTISVILYFIFIIKLNFGNLCSEFATIVFIIRYL